MLPLWAVETVTQMLCFCSFNTLKPAFPKLKMVTGSLIAFPPPLILRINWPCVSCLRDQSSRYLGVYLSVRSGYSFENEYNFYYLLFDI